MKKILFTLLLGLIALISNAQIYSKIKHYDKFDDCIKTENVKTIVNIYNDEDYRYKPITIETKNKQKENYIIVYKSEYGKKDSLIDLTDTNIYGYEIDYICVKEEDYKQIHQKFVNDLYNTDSSFCEITNRVLSGNATKRDSILGTLYFINQENLFYLYKKKDFLQNGFIKEPIYFMTKRYISWSKYRWNYKTDLFWIYKNDGSRIIYSNE